MPSLSVYIELLVSVLRTMAYTQLFLRGLHLPRPPIKSPWRPPWYTYLCLQGPYTHEYTYVCKDLANISVLMLSRTFGAEVYLYLHELANISVLMCCKHKYTCVCNVLPNISLYTGEVSRPT